jgi:hypothetical protein
MLKLTNKQIGIAIDWWAEAIQKRMFDNGDKSPEGKITSMLANMRAIKLTQVQILSFKYELKILLENVDGFRYLSCDYGPIGILYEAAEKAGIPIYNFPWKTSMMFENNGVQISCGWQAIKREILKKEE